MSTSQKMKDFTSEPMGDKPVKALAGIGEVLGDKLIEEGFTYAYTVLGQFLVLGKDEELLKMWLKDRVRANSKQAMSRDNWEGADPKYIGKCYVGGLGGDVTRGQIEEEFREFGSIREIWVAHNPPGFAFVEYYEERDGGVTLLKYVPGAVGTTRTTHRDDVADLAPSLPVLDEEGGPLLETDPGWNRVNNQSELAI
eukprot:sb/3470813/